MEYIDYSLRRGECAWSQLAIIYVGMSAHGVNWLVFVGVNVHGVHWL